MPNPTIDLQRDCELFVDFDTDYFDSQRNKIVDRSGNGRNPEASGGATLGANGPDNFEAASFDGSDDFFDVDDRLNADQNQTVVALFKPVSNGNNEYILNALSGSNGYRFGLENGNFGMIIKDDTGVSVSALVNNSVLNPNQFQFGASIVDDDSIRTVIGRDTVADTTISGYSPATISASIGSDGGNGDFFGGAISFVARWSRALNDAEIEYLNRLTEPRRAQL
jgi:hypothetical protein